MMIYILGIIYLSQIVIRLINRLFGYGLRDELIKDIYYLVGIIFLLTSYAFVAANEFEILLQHEVTNTFEAFTNLIIMFLRVITFNMIPVEYLWYN